MAGLWKTIVGGLEIAAGVALEFLPGGHAMGYGLIAQGAATVISGAVQMAEGGPVHGFGTTTRNPIAPWKVCYGRVRTGGTLVYMHTWGDNDQMLDMVIVLAAHPCEAVDAVLFDQQRVQIDTTAIPTSAMAGYSIPTPAAGSGTSFSPLNNGQTDYNISHITRDSNGVVTVTLTANIPLLTAGDQIMIHGITGDLTLNGTFQVAEIVSQVFGTPGSIEFTYLSGGTPSIVDNEGQARTQWPDYGRNIYVEYLLGNQTLGQTFVGMTAGTPWQGTGRLVSPASPLNAGGTAQQNPWTDYCSLVGKTAAFIRIRLDTDGAQGTSKYFPSGLPQISFLLRGKNDIYDPRTNGLVPAVASGGSGYNVGDVVNVIETGASGYQIAVTGTGTGGAMTSAVAHASGSGYSAANGLSTSAYTGTGSGATINLAWSGTNGYTENSALCIADFLSNQTFGFKCSYGTDIPLNPLVTAANICDQTVSTVIGGTEPMYSCNGQFDLTMRRGEILQNMLTSCAGRIVYQSGQWTIQPANWPGVQLYFGGATSGAVPLAFTGSYRWRPMPSIRDLYNGCKGTYISPANKWQSTDFPAYAQDSLHGYSGPSQYGGDINLAADGGDRRWLELHLPFTISSGMAQRIAKIELLRRRHGGNGTFALSMAGYQFAPLDIVSATVPYLNWSNKLLEVAATRLKFDDSNGAIALGTEIDFVETDSSIYTWSTEEELSPQGYVQSNYPKGSVVPADPWPWSPGYAAPLNGDAIYTKGAQGLASFGVEPVYGVDAQGNASISLEIKGTPPINALDTGVANPQFFTAASSTGGSLAAGDYVVALSAYDSGASNYADTDYLSVQTVYVPGSGSGSITVTPDWGSGDDGGELYIGLWNSTGEYVFHWNQTLAPGATSATITTFDESKHGGPDPVFDHFAVVPTQEIHGGPWAAQVYGVTATAVTIAANGMTLNQWAGHTLSLLAKLNPNVEVPVLNMPVASSTASSGGLFTLTIGPNAAGAQLPDLTTLLAVGDVVMMRHNATFSSTGFSDPNIANGFYPAGATGVEAGHVAVVLSGADAGDVQTIASVGQDGNGNYTIFNLAGQWATTPATGDLVVICAPAAQPEFLSATMQSRNASMPGPTIVAQPNVINLAGQTWLFRVRACDANGNYAPDSLAPFREIYLFGGQGTRTITASATQLLTDGMVLCDTTAGNISFQLLPIAAVPNMRLIVKKISTDANTVTVLPATGETIEGEASATLANAGDLIEVKANG